MQYVDYYKALSVERGASQEEISRAYKQAARKFHPDLNKAPDAEERFKEVNEAHEVLKDPETRRRYDTLGANWKHGADFRPPPGWGDGAQWDVQANPGGAGSDFFEQIFGAGGPRGPGFAGGNGHGPGEINLEDLLASMGGAGMEGDIFGHGGPRRPARGRDVETTLSLSLEDIYHARKIKVRLSGPEGSRGYDVKVPRGVRQGQRIRLSGQGLPGPGGEPGDLYLEVEFAPHPQFSVEGDHLVVTVPVSSWDAALGGSIPVPTLDGEVRMTLPPGLSSGQRLRLQGKGLPREGGGRGDLRAELKITVPEKLTSAQQRLFAELRDASGAVGVQS